MRDLGIGMDGSLPLTPPDMSYDISGFEAIYPPFGTMAHIDTLISEVRRRGMRIILSITPLISTPGSRSRGKVAITSTVISACGNPPDGTRRPSNHWRSMFGDSAREYVPERGQYYLHLFAKEQPDLSWENSVARKVIYEMAIEYWLKKGADGFRADVVNLYSKDILFPDKRILEPDAETQIPFAHCLNGPRIHEFLKEIQRDVLDKYGEDVMMVGRCFVTERGEILRHMPMGRKGLNMIFDFAMVLIVMEFEDGVTKARRWKLPEPKTAITKAQLLKQDTEAWAAVFGELDGPRSLSRYTATDP
jgi:oligo-1,6-glucosidase